MLILPNEQNNFCFCELNHKIWRRKQKAGYELQAKSANTWAI